MDLVYLFLKDRYHIDHTFIHDKATKDFGYKPIITKEVAQKRTLDWFKKQEEAKKKQISNKGV